MKKRTITAVVLVLILVIGFSVVTAAPNKQPVIVSPPPTVAELYRLVNEERAKVGVPTLKQDSQLNQSAQYKADDMLTRDYFSHLDPVSGKKNGLDYLYQTGKKCTWASENIFWGRATNTSEAAVSWWKSSPPHYAAMIDPRYESTGFGISGNKIVEHFCDEQ